MRENLLSLAVVIFAAWAIEDAAAETYLYQGVVTLCAPSCDGFDSLAAGSAINSRFEIDTSPSDAFTDLQMGLFQIEIFNPGLPISGPVGDSSTDNPTVFDSAAGEVASDGTAGFTDEANELSAGQILIEFLVPPLNDNDAFIIFDLATGNGRVCLFYLTAGCIPGATAIVEFEGSFAREVLDRDDDRIIDSEDNCPGDFNPGQEDFDGDGVGYACDTTCATDMDFFHIFSDGDLFAIVASNSIIYEGTMSSGSDLVFGAPNTAFRPGTSIAMGAVFSATTQGCDP